MAYIKSENIKVFPCVSRGADSGNPEANLFAENNYSQTSRSLYTKLDENENKVEGSFVVSLKSNENYFEFVLGGYYFKIDTSDSAWGELSSGNVWAGIKIKEQTSSSYQEIIIENAENENSSGNSNYYSVTDVDGYFEGLLLSSAKPSSDYAYILQLLDNGEIPDTSRIQWNTAHLEDGAVETEKIADASVTTEKIKDGNVTRRKIEDKAVNLNKIDFKISAEVDTSGNYNTLVIELKNND